MKFIRRFNESKLIKVDNSTIFKLIQIQISKYGSDMDLNHIDVSEITDMESLFGESNLKHTYGRSELAKFNGDISLWNTENVLSMNSMFSRSLFNGDISRWNVRNVIDMREMFKSSQFNRDLGRWDVSNVKRMDGMFCWSQFNGDISDWNVEKVESINEMFVWSKFDGDLDKWNPISIKTLYDIFTSSPLENRLPIWLQSMRLSLFKTMEDYNNSMYWDWLRPNRTISRFRLEEAIDYFGGNPSKIDQIRGYTFVK